MPEEPRDCKVCGEVFKNEMFRVIHVRANHPEVLKYTCKCCNRGYETLDAVTRHETSAKKRQKSRARKFESKCVEYALKHGKHKAQLRFSKIHPELKLSWKRISDLISRDGHQDKYDVQKDRMVAVPQAIQQKVAIFAHANGVESAQVHFTKTYPQYLFPHEVVQAWMKATNPNSKFSSTFIKHLNDAIRSRGSTLKISEMTLVSRDAAFDYNKNKTNLAEQITGSNVLEEWCHVVNKKLAELRSLKCKMCGMTAKSVDEIRVHRSSCIAAPDPPKRPSRTAASTTPRATSRTSDSDSIEGDWYSCESCDYKTISSIQYNRHVKSHKSTACGGNGLGGSVAVGRRNIKLELLPCSLCPYQSISEEELAEHYQDVHVTRTAEERNECEKCKENFQNYYSILKHRCSAKQDRFTFVSAPPPTYCSLDIATAIGPVTYLCPRCIKVCSSLEQLRSHYNLECKGSMLSDDVQMAETCQTESVECK